MGAIVIDKNKEVDVEGIVTDGIKGIYEIGFGGLFYAAANTWAKSMNPVVGFCLKLGTSLAGVAYGKVLYNFVDETFDLEEKVHKVFDKEIGDDEDEKS